METSKPNPFAGLAGISYGRERGLSHKEASSDADNLASLAQKEAEQISQKRDEEEKREEKSPEEFDRLMKECYAEGVALRLATELLEKKAEEKAEEERAKLSLEIRGDASQPSIRILSSCTDSNSEKILYEFAHDSESNKFFMLITKDSGYSIGSIPCYVTKSDDKYGFHVGYRNSMIQSPSTEMGTGKFIGSSLIVNLRSGEQLNFPVDLSDRRFTYLPKVFLDQKSRGEVGQDDGNIEKTIVKPPGESAIERLRRLGIIELPEDMPERQRGSSMTGG